jgi:3-oxocholest-4-en-26-oyl-CoA dehydrogenase alpha subunit
MEFKFSAEEIAFRAELRQFLDQELTPEFRASLEGREWSKEFSMKMGERGYLSLAWPKEYGGQEKSHMEQLIFNEEMARYKAPIEWHRRATQQHAFAIMLFGSEEQKQFFVPKIATGELSIANCMSEPDAGSDLANIQTIATQDGDGYILDGQKRWNSGAHYSDYGWLLAKTDPDGKRHRNISMFLLDLHSPGIEMRLIPDLQNIAQPEASSTNEIFLDNVKVSNFYRIGEENRGWYYNATLMDFERSGIEQVVRNEYFVDALTEILQEIKQEEGPSERLTLIKHQLIQLKVECDISRLLSYRIAWMQSKGDIPNYQTSMAKLFKTELSQEIAKVGMEIFGQYGRLYPGGEQTRLGDTKWSRLQDEIATFDLACRAATIAQGTSEIHRNIIALRGLQMTRAK